ncbi:MAG: sensor histidine kinase [Methyloligellaceae bacterium]
MLNENKNSLTILLVDDDQVDRMNVLRAARSFKDDTMIEEVEDIQAGLNLFKTKKFDCILLDYHLPNLNGMEGIEEFRNIDTYVPIVMITGQGDEILAVNALQKGAQYYVPKDKVTAETLWNAVRTAIENSSLKKKVEHQKEELESFSHILAHDLKAPIRTILSFQSRVQRAIEENNPDKISKYQGMVERSAIHMNSLIDTLSQYSQVDQEEISFRTISLEECAELAINNLNEMLTTRDAQVSYAQLPRAYAHAPLIVQLLQNLISNGVKYCPEKPPIIHIDFEDLGIHWKVLVKDNGIGIPENKLKFIFAPFKRLHNKDEFDGTGLGLATCKKILQRCHGKIWCESQVGTGSTFIFTLPKPANQTVIQD